MLICLNFHHIPVTQPSGEGTQFAVNLATHRVVTHVRVNLVSEVNGGGTLWQGNNLSLRRKRIEAIREQVHLDVFKEFATVGTITLNFHQVG